ncbi:acyl-coa n-acyltransferase [Lucifera butyrica]|uniref:Acyl-coa n-acyltransferase n=1 Tax=Lucifera butyrica TaxID=1351585 RepID=A0A498RBU7_9FIRM|nr:N-acetyltransferase [Lucifera butyrica]VBB08719.1 acyl-coa n-acyltransferase [Lucifera butyrica]
MIYRKAIFQDVESIHKLVNTYAEQGLMLGRSRNILYETLRDMVVAENDGEIAGVAALHLVWDELVEIRALAVAPEATQQGVGRRIVETLLKEAKELGAKTVFALTYQPGFFKKLGFHEIPKEQLSPKVWKECINCAKFPNCDEIAMVKEL